MKIKQEEKREIAIVDFILLTREERNEKSGTRTRIKNET
jgi:hypothetical protein